ncbi:IclR family transcriptional regulator [Rhodobacteraceae bacterium SC52]|nr:IclR family transcriptional regulator [Rhodobacteraceae bacterium SC52]
MANPAHSGASVQSAEPGPGTVGKALEVLDAVAAHSNGIRFAELQAQSRYPKATLYRLVQTLVREGMVRHDPDTGLYALGMRLVRLAHVAWRQSSLAPIARPHLDQLSAEVGQTVHLAQLDHAQVLYVDKRNAAQPVQMYSEAGKVGPAYCTGVGKVMLAHVPTSDLDGLVSQQSFHRFTPNTLTDAPALLAELAQIRADGVGFDREEHEPGIICIAVPVLSRRGRLLGAMSVTGRADSMTEQDLAAYLPALRAAATRITEDTEAWRFPDAQGPA